MAYIGKNWWRSESALALNRGSTQLTGAKRLFARLGDGLVDQDVIAILIHRNETADPEGHGIGTDAGLSLHALERLIGKDAHGGITQRLAVGVKNEISETVLRSSEPGESADDVIAFLAQQDRRRLRFYRSHAARGINWRRGWFGKKRLGGGAGVQHARHLGIPLHRYNHSR